MLERYTKLASSEQINQLVDQLAQEIIRDYPDKSPLFIALLRGAGPFASRLMFALTKVKHDYHPELEYMIVSTYGEDHTAKQPVIVTDVAPNTKIEGRQVIILDDVIDQGITSDFIKKVIEDRGAADVKLAVFATKTVPERQSEADYYCFDAGDSWLVGFGLDDAGLTHEGYRWIDELWEINR